MDKIKKVREILSEKDLDAVLVMSAHNRRYLSDFTGSAGSVIVTQDEAILVSDFRYKAQGQEQAKNLNFVLQKGGHLPFVIELLESKGIKKLGFEGHLTTYNTYAELDKSFELTPLTAEIEKIRMVKSDDEVAVIQKACDIADKTYEHILTFVKAGMTELDVKNELERKMRELGASGASFDIIVASGARGALPHGVASDKVIEDGDMVTLDFGALYNGYISDITRTFAVGKPSDEMKKVYDVVLESQLLALEKIKPGMKASEADAVSRDVIASHGYGENFGHSLGHGIGLEVHEGPGIASSVDTILEEGMCITIEPGIYIDGVGGVRIEDDCLVTKDGLKRLTNSSKELFIL